MVLQNAHEIFFHEINKVINDKKIMQKINETRGKETIFYHKICKLTFLKRKKKY